MTARTRRANGESSIYQDDAGRFHGWVSLGYRENGRRDRRHVSGKTRAEVVGKVRALEAKREAGLAATAGRAPTVGVWLEEWVTVIAPRRVRWSTLRWYRTVVTLHLAPHIGHHRIDRLEPSHLEALYSMLEVAGKTASAVQTARIRLAEAKQAGDPAAVELAKAALRAAEDRHRTSPEPLAPETVRHIHRVISRALKVACQRQKVARNVAELVDAPSVPEVPIEPLTEEQARRLIAAAAEKRNGARWALALALGLRQGEALGLRWRNITLDGDAPTLSVVAQLQRQTGRGLVLVEVKSDAGKRTIPLPRPLCDMLRAHRAAQRAERLAAGPLWQAGDFVFCQPNGCPIEPRADNRSWYAFLADVGVPPKRLHDARHTAGTLLAAMGEHPRTVMAILGHSSQKATMRYTHAVPDVVRGATERMGDALFGSSG